MGGCCWTWGLGGVSRQVRTGRGGRVSSLGINCPQTHDEVTSGWSGVGGPKDTVGRCGGVGIMLAGGGRGEHSGGGWQGAHGDI